MRLRYINLLIICLPAVLGAINGKCSSGNGVCDPKNVKCCNKPKCVAPNGQVGSCKFVSSCKNGKVYANLCPGGNDFKCCVPNKKTTTTVKKSTTIKKKTTTPVKKVTGTKIVNYAKKFIGNPYVWGGNSLTKGCDCSGFTQQIYKHFGITINRVAADQAKQGTKVANLKSAKAGDLVFYCDNSKKVTHVAIYEGNNRIVHAANSKDGIKESNANYKTPCKIKRFI
ncbi:hypothetical protein BCR32DRAFT_327279 [Anaeromyces robustus]|uniref:NlpC/P60 domain-containing protein n=1 Tax=Anaeromyces robustus TaxID=1754192 RepID=A0A1Y1X7Y6_9FUNG|nr:hypothetical protein BCR32DRAFT_327279 [Anaeromyces robustus]|eukprot:ORX81496.1 hypothetical protein BCR32DRAFT_327279 [Anaeromyces robustus]